MAVMLYRDDHNILVNWEFPRGQTSMSNALILGLEEGSTVYMRVPPGCEVYDDPNTPPSVVSCSTPCDWVRAPHVEKPCLKVFMDNTDSTNAL